MLLIVSAVVQYLLLVCVSASYAGYVGDPRGPNNYYGRDDLDSYQRDRKGYSTKLDFYKKPTPYDSIINIPAISPIKGISVPLDYNDYSPSDDYRRVGKGFNIFGGNDLENRYNHLGDILVNGYKGIVNHQPPYGNGYGYTYTSVGNGQPYANNGQALYRQYIPTNYVPVSYVPTYEQRPNYEDNVQQAGYVYKSPQDYAAKSVTILNK